VAVFKIQCYCLKEHHLQRALSAQQVYGTAEALVIPVPDINDVGERYQNLYQLPKEYKPPRQYVHVQREYSTIGNSVLCSFCSV